MQCIINGNMGPNNRLHILVLFLLSIIVWMYLSREKDVIYNGYRSYQEHQSHQTFKYPADPFHDLLVLYNRVPKTGSTTFMNIMYQLTTTNKFSAAYVNVSSKGHRWLFQDQYRFAQNITSWEQRKPALYHGHFPFVSFIPMGFKQPLYINIVREPLDRLVSHYYFLRYGDTYLPNKKRIKQGDKTTFDDCVEKKLSDCAPEKLWIQIPYFCGSDSDCWKPGNKGALHRAKRNFLNYYFLVGTTEKLGSFIEILDKTLPRIFRGATKAFNVNGGLHVRKTKTKLPLQEKTRKHFESNVIWKMEHEFYMFVKERFEMTYRNFKKKGSLEYIKVKPEL